MKEANNVKKGDGMTDCVRYTLARGRAISLRRDGRGEKNTQKPAT